MSLKKQENLEMTNMSQSEWKPIEDMPIYLGLFREIYANNKEQYDNLLKAKDKPHVLDDYTIQQIIKIYSEQEEEHWA